MPYIVTTHRHLDDPTGEFLPGAEPAITRRAVATLDGVLDFISYHYGPVADWRANSLVTEQGGTVPLPDGTVIEVERVKLGALMHRTWAGVESKPEGWATASVEQVVAAYNAAQETVTT